jgi:hypothetical protein
MEAPPTLRYVSIDLECGTLTARLDAPVQGGGGANRCAIYLLCSSLRHTSCWVSAITGGTGPKITGDSEIFRGGNRGASLWGGGRRSRCLAMVGCAFHLPPD